MNKTIEEYSVIELIDELKRRHKVKFFSDYPEKEEYNLMLKYRKSKNISLCVYADQDYENDIILVVSP